MAGITDTLNRLRAYQRELGSPARSSPPSLLEPLSNFGSNPGALGAWSYAPARGEKMALVVLLHGCTQNARDFARDTGWAQLAERHGFALLCPDQRRSNNPNLCFNWYLEDDHRRDRGEALSIRQMIATMAERHAIDPRRVFVAGLSAGGAMTAAMLAAYPELFAGGSIIAGLPYGSASSVSQALTRMRRAGRAEADQVRDASPHDGPWPTITIWHGDADRIVDVTNADALVEQWRTLHGAAATPHRIDTLDGQRHRVWLRADGREAVEDIRIVGLGHGVPLSTGGADGCGIAGAYMLAAGISATRRQAESWGLLERRGTAPMTAGPDLAEAKAQPERPSSAVQAIIEGALRTAGLLR